VPKAVGLVALTAIDLLICAEPSRIANPTIRLVAPADGYSRSAGLSISPMHPGGMPDFQMAQTR